jgi:rfaE bifunctional protein nucleotidyltransferase chain/domain
MSAKQKILPLASLLRTIAQLRRSKKKIAFTNGCFDILHIGHVSYLEEAKKKGDVLVVGLNSDKSVQKIKGPKRPIVPEKERAFVLGGLASVDYVVLFNEDTPQKLIEKIKPNVMVKGADWKGKEVAGADFVKSYGGKMELIKFIPNHSSTDIIKTILNKCAA